MESTGHYFKLLYNFLETNEYEIIVANPIQTESIKNIGIREVKNDKVDARKIALLYRLGELKSSNVPKDDIFMLRGLCRQYYDLVREQTAYKNRLIGVVDQRMLNYKDVFNDICCNTSLPYKSITPARYSQPSSVHIYVMSETHFKFDLSAVKSWFNRFSATGRLCLELVVALYFLTVLDLIHSHALSVLPVPNWLSGLLTKA
jgi:hypothetical protein